MRQPTHPTAADLKLVNVLYALSDPLRLDVVQKLANDASMPCCALDQSVAKSTLSHHLRVLREAGLIWTTVEGTQHRSCLRRGDLDERFPGLLDAVLTNLMH